MSAFDPLRTFGGLRQEADMHRWKLFALATAVGVAVPAAYSVLYSVLTHQPLALGRDVDAVNVVIVAAPYLLLALLRVSSILPWAVALGLTVSVWGMWLHSTVTYKWHPDGSGVDFGTIFLIFASPIFISIVAFAVDAFQQWHSARR